MCPLNKNNDTSERAAIPDFAKSHPAWFRLENQLAWYSSKSKHNQRWYKSLKIAQVLLALLVPVTSLMPSVVGKWVAAIAGILIAVFETVQQMNQYSTLWVTYRSTAERLKHEKYLFLSGAGPYRNLSEPESLVLLAERVEEHVSKEHSNWFNETRRQNADQKNQSA